MCGICLIVYRSKDVHEVESFLEEQTAVGKTVLDNHLDRRGPDCSASYHIQLKDYIILYFRATVLWLQGEKLQQQPCEKDGNVFMWNGNIFGGLQVPFGKSDTSYLFQLLLQCSTDEEFLKVFTQIKGPYTFMYWDHVRGKLWFGRDVFGRHSLLWNFTSRSDDEPVVLASLGDGNASFSEVPAVGVFCWDVSSFMEGCVTVSLFPWKTYLGSVRLNATCELLNKFVSITDESLITPVENKLNLTIPSEDMLPNGIFVESVFNPEKTIEMFCRTFSDYITEFETRFTSAVMTRVKHQPGLCMRCVKGFLNDRVRVCCRHSKIGILFSGGIDSAVIAAFADRCLPLEETIDLINVAFEQEIKNPDGSSSRTFDVPDRLTGSRTFEELKLISPCRKWNFVKINVTKDELQEARNPHVAALVHPLQSVLDDSIGCAIWFAARGRGVVGEDGEEYFSPCRVVLVGMGADEQLGGYSRHRAQFSREGWTGLLDELQLELDRISERNLGRDDRTIADHGREARFPFLDEDLVSFLNSIQVSVKCNLNFPRGFGEKLLLRMLAWKLGLSYAALLAKRAIQFGSRIAKLENSKEHGSDVCQRLKRINPSK